MKFKALIFDLDGTLVDSPLDFAAMRRDLGLPEGAPILEAIHQMSEERQQWAYEVLHQHEWRGVMNSKPIPGVLDFLDEMKRSGLPMAVFTRNSRKSALETLKLHDLNFEVVVAREDAPPKPRPDGLKMIARAWDLESQMCLFVGDYLFDLQAGQAAGVPTALYLPEPADFDTSGSHFEFQNYTELATFIKT